MARAPFADATAQRAARLEVEVVGRRILRRPAGDHDFLLRGERGLHRRGELDAAVGEGIEHGGSDDADAAAGDALPGERDLGDDGGEAQGRHREVKGAQAQRRIGTGATAGIGLGQACFLYWPGRRLCR